ncbi:MAG: hypothetical protein ACE5ID_10950, partial [Acidobacteriota bacterium]
MNQARGRAAGSEHSTGVQAPAGPKKAAGNRPPAWGSRRFQRGLLFSTVVFAALVLLDVALVGHLIFRDLSRQVINEARIRSRQEAENIARRLSPEAGVQPAADIYRVVETTRMFARYLDRVLQKYMVIQQIEILNSKGETLYSRARRAEILRKNGELQPEESSPPSLAAPLNPPPGGASPERSPEEAPPPDPAEQLLARMGIPLPAVQLGPEAPLSVARFGHRRSAYD